MDTTFALPVSVQLLLSKKADVNKMSTNGVTALLAAAYMKQRVVDMLLAKGANVNAQTIDTGMTPLMYAAKEGNASRVKSLRAYHADATPKNK